MENVVWHCEIKKNSHCDITMLWQEKSTSQAVVLFNYGTVKKGDPIEISNFGGSEPDLTLDDYTLKTKRTATVIYIDESCMRDTSQPPFSLLEMWEGNSLF